MHRLARQALDNLPEQTTGLLDGAPFPSPSHDVPLIDPDTGERVGTLGGNGADQVERAVAHAVHAFRDGRWSDLAIEERADVLRQSARAIRDNADQLAALDSLTTGLLYHSSTRRHVTAAADWFDYFAALASEETMPSFASGADITTVVMRKPVGVVGLFTPWNIPMMAAGLKLAAALVMGNCVVLKPSELSPLASYRLVELLHEAGLPAGVLQLVNGRGDITGKALAEHCDVAAVSFTGGPAAGSAIAAAAASRFAKVTMELGGKSANIILADAPYDAALDGTLAAAFSNSGQACLAGSRILVEAAIADRFVSDLVDRTRSLKIGHTFDQAARIGPQSCAAQMERVLSYADCAVQEGGELLCGGRRAPGFAGYQVEPGLVRVPDNSLRICREEVFGPLATIQVVADADEAIAVANDTDFGLAGYVWSEDAQKAAGIAARLRTGTVLVNTPMMRERGAPFGGFGASGVDREGGRWSLDFYSEAKTVVTRQPNAFQQKDSQ